MDGRYLLKFDLNTIKEGDIIKCFIDNNNLNSNIDCGELLALINLRDNDTVLSIGAYDISEEYYGRVQEKFAYEIRYLINHQSSIYEISSISYLDISLPLGINLLIRLLWRSLQPLSIDLSLYSILRPNLILFNILTLFFLFILNLIIGKSEFLTFIKPRST